MEQVEGPATSGSAPLASKGQRWVPGMVDLDGWRILLLTEFDEATVFWSGGVCECVELAQMKAPDPEDFVTALCLKAFAVDLHDQEKG